MLHPRSMKRQAGYSLIEALTVVALLGLAAGSAPLFLRRAEAPLDNGFSLTEAFLRRARARAVATTSACRVTPAGRGRLVVSHAATCGALAWTAEDDLALDLPRGVTLDDDTWSLCFDGRGLSNENRVIALSHPDYGTRSIEVLLGGATRELR